MTLLLGQVAQTDSLTVRYTSIDQVVGQIYSLCKDQHGCRFLQKKLEDNNPAVTELIFNETYPHFDELMTGSCFLLFRCLLPCLSDVCLLTSLRSLWKLLVPEAS